MVPGTRSSAEVRPFIFVLTVVSILSLKLFLTINREAVNIFYWDQWDFNDPILFAPRSLWGKFSYEHAPHRQGMGALVGWLVGSLSNWNTRAEAFTIAAIVLLACLCALWLKQRLYGSLSFVDAVVPMLFFTRVQWETYLGSTNPAHGSLPLLLVTLYCLAWTCPRDRWKYPLLLIASFLATYTGFGLFLGFITPVLLAIDAYSRLHAMPRTTPLPALASCLISIVSVSSFFIGYESAPGCFSFSAMQPLHYLVFICLMFSRFFSARGYYLSLVCGAAVLLIIAAIVRVNIVRALNRSPDQWTRTMVILALVSFSLLFGAGAAVGRICVGDNPAQASRYMIYLVPGYLGLYCYLFALEGRLRRDSLAVLAVFALLASFPSGVARPGQMGKERQSWKDCYLKSEDIRQCNELTHTEIYPYPEDIHLKEKLLFLKQHHYNLYDH